MTPYEFLEQIAEAIEYASDALGLDLSVGQDNSGLLIRTSEQMIKISTADVQTPED